MFSACYYCVFYVSQCFTIISAIQWKAKSRIQNNCFIIISFPFFILSFYQSCMFIQLTLSGTNNIHIHTYKYNANGVFYSFVFKCNDFIRNTTFYKMLYTSRHKYFNRLQTIQSSIIHSDSLGKQ